MTDKLIETFNLPIYDMSDNNDNSSEEDYSQYETEDESITGDDFSETQIEEEMDKVFETGLENFKEMMNYSYNIEEKHAAAVMAAAAKILEITMNSSKIKDEQKLKMMELCLKKEQQEHNIKMSKLQIGKGKVDNTTLPLDNPQQSNARLFDRNEHIRTLKAKAEQAKFEDKK